MSALNRQIKILPNGRTLRCHVVVVEEHDCLTLTITFNRWWPVIIWWTPHSVRQSNHGNMHSLLESDTEWTALTSTTVWIGKQSKHGNDRTVETARYEQFEVQTWVIWIYYRTYTFNADWCMWQTDTAILAYSFCCMFRKSIERFTLEKCHDN